VSEAGEVFVEVLIMLGAHVLRKVVAWDQVGKRWQQSSYSWSIRLN
jgi:hypothetical protein